MSQGGAAYFAGKVPTRSLEHCAFSQLTISQGVANDKQQASVAGAVAGAHYIRQVATSYEIPGKSSSEVGPNRGTILIIYPSHPPHRSLCKKTAPVAGRHARCGRGILQGTRGALILQSHDRSLRGGSRLQYPDNCQVPETCSTYETMAGNGDWQVLPVQPAWLVP